MEPDNPIDEQVQTPSVNQPAASTPLGEQQPATVRRSNPDIPIQTTEAGEGNVIGGQDAESIRRAALTPPERLREDGVLLQRMIEMNGDIFAILQKTPPVRKRKCFGKADCLLRMPDHRGGNLIQERCRICVRNTRPTVYFHLECFNHMVDIYELIPNKFKLANGPGPWPLMIKEWYQHRGKINAEGIARYLDAMDLYDIALRKALQKREQWQVGHRLFCEDVGLCTCPPKAAFPIKPMMESPQGVELDRLRLEYIVTHPGCRWPTEQAAAPVEGESE